MINVLTILIILVLILITILYLLISTIFDKVRIPFGYKKYEYTKILSHGMKNEYMWHKTEEEALKYHKDYEFVTEILPHHRRIRPND